MHTAHASFPKPLLHSLSLYICLKIMTGSFQKAFQVKYLFLPCEPQQDFFLQKLHILLHVTEDSDGHVINPKV